MATKPPQPQPTPTPPPTDDQNEILRRRAHERVDQLFAECVGGRFYGRVGLEIAFEGGQAKEVRRRLEGTDR